jgi:nitrite reductase/ring-hydroxylating ferredoxin subunit
MGRPGKEPSTGPPAAARIRDFPGETPLQVMARQDVVPRPAMTSLERFPYYTAFPWAWYAAGFADDLAPGEVRPTHLLARDLVLWRDESGVAHVMDAYCPHLGANLALGGRVRGDNLVCPYHWWEWDGDGRNAHIPYSDRTNTKACLRAYPTVERNGFVLFWYHPDPAQPPLFEIPRHDEYFTAEWRDVARCDWEVRCPWQELGENAPDYIHLKTVHGAATVPVLEELTYDGPRSSLRSRVDFDTPRGPTPGRIDTDTWGPGFGLARFEGIIPTVFFNATTPIDWERTWSVKAYRVRIEGDDDEARAHAERVGAALVADLRKQMAEDNVIFDNKIHVASPALTVGDGPIMEFRRWAAQFYVDGDPVAAHRTVP